MQRAENSFSVEKGGVNFYCVNNNGENSFSLYADVLCGWSIFLLKSEGKKSKRKEYLRSGERV